MRKRLTKWLVTILVCIICLTSAIPAFASDVYTGPENFREYVVGAISSSDRQNTNDYIGDGSKYVWASCDKAYLNLLSEYRNAMKSRQTEIVLTYHTSDPNVTVSQADAFAKTLSADALMYTGNPEEGDYLFWSFNQYTYYAEVSRNIKGSDITVRYSYDWRTSAGEEQEVGYKIDQAFDSFCWNNSTSDYEKTCDICSYLCDNVVYDHEHFNSDSSYRPMYTAYSAIVNDSAVCQGITLAAYRMFLKAGIDCRCIYGSSHGENHLWNIVKLGGCYYNVDITWDLGSDISDWQWFLKSDGTFSSDHSRSNSYTTSSFYTTYPMSATDYEQTSVHEHAYQKDDSKGEVYVCTCGAMQHGDGLCKDSDGSWKYYKNGEVDTSYTGFVDDATGKWYVENGMVSRTKSGLIQDEFGSIGESGSWWYVKNGKVRTDYTGVMDFKKNNQWWYVKDGQVDFSANTIAENSNGWWYVKDGKVDFSFTGLSDFSNENGWWYVADGKVDFAHNGVAKNKNGWWYVKDGKVQLDFAGLVTPDEDENTDDLWYISNGEIKHTLNSWLLNDNSAWEVAGGKIVN